MPRKTLPDDVPRRTLAQLDRNIVQTDLLVLRQIARVELMAEKGEDTTKAKAVLYGLGMVLEYWYAQREILLTPTSTSEDASKLPGTLERERAPSGFA
jgi:hypothetical protein